MSCDIECGSSKVRMDVSCVKQTGVMYLSFRFTGNSTQAQAQFILHQKSNSKNHQQKGFDPERKIWDIYR